MNETMSVTTMNRTTTRRPLLIAAAIVVALGVGLYLSGSWRTAQVVRETLSQPLGGAKSADVTIGMGVGRLRIAELPQPGDLIAGEIAYPEANRVDRTFAMRGDTATFKLYEQDSQRNNLIKYRNDDAVWDLRLNPAIPMRLTIEAGVGESTLNLAQLKVTDLDLKTGIGATTLTLPREGQLQAHVEGGVGQTTVRIPSGVAVRIALDAEIGKMERLKTHTTIFYSTHILEDVQRVSDSVAILNRGQLVAQAPIEQLLNGSGITYSLTVRGDADAARTRIAGQPWVASVVDDSGGGTPGTTTLQVRVTNAEAAEAQLLRLILDDESTTVIEFGRTKQNLEAIFLQIIEGGTSNGNHS
jgi:hypothetical protein